MKKVTNLITLVVLFTLIFSACTIQKRHYMPGYHVEWHKKTNARSADATTDQLLPSSEMEENTEETNRESRSEITVNREQPTEEAVISEESAATDRINEDERPAPSVEAASKKETVQQLPNKKDPSTNTDDHPRIVLAILFLLLGLFPVSVYFTEGKTQNFRISLVVSILSYLFIIVGAILVITFVILPTTAVTAAGIAGLLLMGISIIFVAIAFIHALIVLINKIVRG